MNFSSDEANVAYTGTGNSCSSTVVESPALWNFFKIMICGSTFNKQFYLKKDLTRFNVVLLSYRYCLTNKEA